jgi:hypothetical protein
VKSSLAVVNCGPEMNLRENLQPRGAGTYFQCSSTQNYGRSN